MADKLGGYLKTVGHQLGLNVSIYLSDGSQPIGRGIGPALEARDVVAVLQNDPSAPQDLRNHALNLAEKILRFSPSVKPHEGLLTARDILNSGRAWTKFQSICDAQGGMRDICPARYTHTITAPLRGRVMEIDNRRIARVAKLAGAPTDKEAGVDLHKHLGSQVEEGEPIYTIHANSLGAIDYALAYIEDQAPILRIDG